MKKIALLSDTHSFLDPKLEGYFAESDEIWHAGDIGDLAVADTLESWGKPFRAVYGNIDGHQARIRYPENLHFALEGVVVFMTHIGGYPPRYNPRVRPILEDLRPKLFICGHSHILKAMPDKKLALLHLNPGAAGQYGWHKVRTAMRFHLNKGRIENLEVIELGKRGGQSI